MACDVDIGIDNLSEITAVVFAKEKKERSDYVNVKI